MYRFDADHSGEIDHEETIGIIECILDGKVPLLLCKGQSKTGPDHI